MRQGGIISKKSIFLRDIIHDNKKRGGDIGFIMFNVLVLSLRFFKFIFYYSSVLFFKHTTYFVGIVKDCI